MPSQSRGAVIATVVKAIEAIAAKSNLDTETRRFVEDVVAKAK